MQVRWSYATQEEPTFPSLGWCTNPEYPYLLLGRFLEVPRVFKTPNTKFWANVEFPKEEGEGVGFKPGKLMKGVPPLWIFAGLTQIKL